MRRKKCITRILLLVILSLTVTGCGLQDFLDRNGKNSDSSQKENQTAIGVILDDRDPNKALIRQGIEDMAAKDNIKVVDLSETGQSAQSGSQSENKSDGSSSDKTGQNGIESLKAILYHGGLNHELLSLAEEKNIPVIAINQIPPSAKVTGIICPDLEEAGRLMGNMLLSKVSEGEIAILQDDSQAFSRQLLSATQGVLKKNPKIISHVITNPAGGESVALQSFSSLVEKKGAKLKGVIAYSETLAAQAYEVLKQAKLERQVALIGGQANLQSLKRIDEGGQIGDIDTSPYLQGVNAYQMASNILKQNTLDMNDSVVTDQGIVPAKKIPVKEVTQENLELIKNDYTKAMNQAMAAQKQKEEQDRGTDAKSGGEKKKGEEKQADSKEGEGKGEEKPQGDSEGSGEGSQGSGGGGSKGQNGVTSVPEEAAKVRERIKTETIREYLDEKGNVISTEQTVVEENRVVPPESLEEKDSGQSEKGQPQEKSTDQQSGSENMGGFEGG